MGNPKRKKENLFTHSLSLSFPRQSERALSELDDEWTKGTASCLGETEMQVLETFGVRERGAVWRVPYVRPQ